MADPAVSALFDREVDAVRALSFRDDLHVEQIAAPQGLAPFSFALAAAVDTDTGAGVGQARVVVLFDPQGQDGWEGVWRIVGFAQAPLEPEIASDPMLADVAFSWLTDALKGRRVTHRAMAGTVSTTQSRGFGVLSSDRDGALLEVRVSWTADAQISRHVAAWAEFAGMVAGLPPGSDRIDLLTARRTMRD